MDTSIPRRSRSGPRALPPTTGWFQREARGVVLRSLAGDRWTLPYVSIIQGWWGFDGEGVAKLPRPREYDAAGNVVVEGDRVVIEFLDGAWSRPLVRGGVRSTRAVDFLPYNHESPNGDANRLAMRVAPRDATGAESGVVEVEVAADGLGSLAALLSDGATLTVRRGTSGGLAVALTPSSLRSQVGAGVPVEQTAGEVVVGGATADAMVKATAFQAGLRAVLLEIVAGFAAAVPPFAAVVTTAFAETLAPPGYGTSTLRAE